MYLTTDLRPTTDFTKVMNEVIFDQDLTHAEFRLWCRLLALPRGADQVIVEADNIADQFGISAVAFRKQRQALKDKGYLIQEKSRLVVTIPGENFKPKEAKLTKEQQIREDLKNTWNSFKPDGYTRLRSPLSLDQVDTLKLHAEHNSEPDLCKFLTAVLNGCKADGWWKDKNLKPDNVFGTGTPKQNKFTNVEKLYKLSSSDKGRAAVWSASSDDDWLTWFQSKGLTTFSKVERYTVADRFEGWDHEVANPSKNIIRVYCDTEGEVVHWTYKQIPSNFVTQLPTA